jgi:hypothetical protein
MAAVKRYNMTPPPSPTGEMNNSTFRPGMMFTMTVLNQVREYPATATGKKSGFNRGVG